MKTFQLFVWRDAHCVSLLVSIDGDNIKVTGTEPMEGTLDELAQGNQLAQDVAAVIRGYADVMDELHGSLTFRPEDCAFSVEQQIRVPTGTGCRQSGYRLTRDGDDEDTYTRTFIIDADAAADDARKKREFAQQCRERVKACVDDDTLTSAIIQFSGPSIAAEAVEQAYLLPTNLQVLAVMQSAALATPDALKLMPNSVRDSLAAAGIERNRLPEETDGLKKFAVATYRAFAYKMGKAYA